MLDEASPTVAELQRDGVLLVEDGNHGEYRPRPDEFEDGGTTFIRATDIKEGQIHFKGAAGISDVALARIRKGVGQAGDVLFSHKGTVGKVARAGEDAPPFVCSPQTTFWRVLDEERLSRDYLHVFMRSPMFIDQWWGIKGATDMADYVSLTTQRTLRVPVPPLDIQRRIAAPVRLLDELIENNTRRIQILEEMAQAIYREWFVEFRYPGHEDVPLVDSDLGPIPQGWEMRELGEVVSVDKGLSYKGVFLTDEGLPMANLKCFRPGGGFRRHGTKPYSGEFKPKHAVTPGDLIVANTDLTQAGAVIGSPAIIPNAGFEEGGLISHHLFVARFQDQGVERGYLYYLLQDERFRGFARGTASGTTVLGFRSADFLSYVFPCAPPSLQERFGELVGDIHSLSEGLEDANANLRASRDLLLPRLISGEIDVSGLDIDVGDAAA